MSVLSGMENVTTINGIDLTGLSTLNDEMNKLSNKFSDLKGVTEDMKGALGAFQEAVGLGVTVMELGFGGLLNTINFMKGLVDEASGTEFQTNKTKMFLENSGVTNVDQVLKETQTSDLSASRGVAASWPEMSTVTTDFLKKGFELEQILGSGTGKGLRDSTATYAQVSEKPVLGATPEVLKFVNGFKLELGEYDKGLDSNVRYAATKGLNPDTIVQRTGMVADTAMNAWEGRDNMAVLDDTALLAVMTNKAAIDSYTGSSSLNRETSDNVAGRDIMIEFLSSASTDIKSMSEESLKAFQSMGIVTKTTDSKGNESYQNKMLDQNGMLKDLEGLQQVFREAAASIDDKKLFATTAQTALGSKGALAVPGLMESDIGALKDKAQSNKGMDSIAETQMGTYTMQMSEASQEVSNLKSVIGANFLQPAAEGIQMFNEMLADMTDALAQNEGLVKFISMLTLGALTVLTITGVILILIEASTALKAVFSTIGPAIMAPLPPLLPLMGVVLAAVLAIAAVAAVIKRNWEKIGPVFESVFNTIKELVGIVAGKVILFAENIVAPVLGMIGGAFEKVVVFILTYVLPIFDGALQVIISLLTGDLKGAIAEIITTGEGLAGTFGPILGLLAMIFTIVAAKTLIAAAALMIFRGATMAMAAGQAICNAIMSSSVLKMEIHKISTLASAVATGVFSAAQAVLSAIMTMSPLGWIILLLGGILGIILYVAGGFDKLAESVGKAWNSFMEWLGIKDEATEGVVESTVKTTEESETVVKTTVDDKGAKDTIDGLTGKKQTTVDIKAGGFDVSQLKDMGLSDEQIAQMDLQNLEIPAGIDYR